MSASKDESTRLSTRKTGFHGLIRAIRGDDELVERLHEMGLLPGEQIKLRARTFWGNPLIVEFRSTCIALRSSEAECIECADLS